MKVFRIADWSTHFENADSRKLVNLPWIRVPTKQEGDGYTELMSGHLNGCAHFGAWTAVLQLAAKCSQRGTLTRQLGGRCVPHDLASISRITRVPVEVLREAMPRLIDMGWMEEVDITMDKADPLTPPDSPGDAGGFPGPQPENTRPRGEGEESRGEQRRGERETPPTPPASPSQSATPSPASNRERLLALLKEHRAKLEIGSDMIFPEWVDTCEGFRLAWVAHIFDTVRPKIKLPSELRKALKAQMSEYSEWKHRNPPPAKVAGTIIHERLNP